MAKRKTWKSVLTKKEKAHLKENGIRTKKDLKAMKKHISEQFEKNKKEYPENPYIGVCWDCYDIIHKIEKKVYSLED